MITTPVRGYANQWQSITDRMDLSNKPAFSADDLEECPLYESLNPYSRQVYEAFLTALPQLADFAHVDNGPGAPEGSLLIRVPQTMKPQEPGLYISTDVQEITVGFRACYVHFMDYDHTGTDEHIQRAIAYTQDLMADRIVIKKWYRHGILCGSCLDTPSVLPSPSQNGITTVEMISWTGSEDKTVTVPAAAA